jgi:hypothetical protein
MKKKTDFDCELIELKTGNPVFKGSFSDCWNHPLNESGQVNETTIRCLSHEAAEKYRAELREKQQFQKDFHEAVEKALQDTAPTQRSLKKHKKHKKHKKRIDKK